MSGKSHMAENHQNKMKYKIQNKSETYIKYAKILFTPKEVKILELENPYSHEDFNIEKIETQEQNKVVRRYKK